jgi:hypothetical protein
MLLQFCQNPLPALRQAAIYGVGVSALSGAAEFKPFAQYVLQAATQLVALPNSRDDENCHVTDNAVSAVIKCLAKHSEAVDVMGSLNLAINYMPFTHDVDEMATSFEYIVDLMTSNLDAVIGANAVNLPKIIHGMAVTIYHTTYEEESVSRRKIIAICKQMAARPDLLAKMQAILGTELRTLMFFITFSRSRFLRRSTRSDRRRRA